MSERVWEEISRTLRGSAPYRSLIQGHGDAVRLPVPAAAWIGEMLARDLRRPLLVVVPREADALAWIEAARLFLGDVSGAGYEERVVYFPAPSLTPYQEAETSLLVRAQESVALDRVGSGAATTVVATPRALFRRLPAAADFAAAVREIRPGQDHSLDELTEHLVRFGFRRTDLVYEVGDFAVRGGILDLFPPARTRPCGSTCSATRWSRSAGSIPRRSAPKTRSTRCASCLCICSQAVRRRRSGWRASWLAGTWERWTPTGDRRPWS